MQAANDAIAVLEQQILDLQARIPAPAAVQPQAAPIFALSPAGIRVATFLDYSTAGGAKIFKSATDPLSVKFNLDIENLDFRDKSPTARMGRHSFQDPTRWTRLVSELKARLELTDEGQLSDYL